MAKNNPNTCNKGRLTSQIQSRPVLHFRGVPQSDEFTSGAFRMRDLLVAMNEADRPWTGNSDDEIALAESFVDRIVELFRGRPDVALGAAAALAHCLTEDRTNPDGLELDGWTPLERKPVLNVVGNDPYHSLRPGAQCFTLDGEPVQSCAEQLESVDQNIGSPWCMLHRGKGRKIARSCLPQGACHSKWEEKHLNTDALGHYLSNHDFVMDR
jgi:hypothetical protein